MKRQRELKEQGLCDLPEELRRWSRQDTTHGRQRRSTTTATVPHLSLDHNDILVVFLLPVPAVRTVYILHLRRGCKPARSTPAASSCDQRLKLLDRFLTATGECSQKMVSARSVHNAHREFGSKACYIPTTLTTTTGVLPSAGVNWTRYMLTDMSPVILDHLQNTPSSVCL